MANLDRINEVHHRVVLPYRKQRPDNGHSPDCQCTECDCNAPEWVYTLCFLMIKRIVDVAPDPIQFARNVLQWCSDGNEVERSNALQTVLAISKGNRIRAIRLFLYGQGYDPLAGEYISHTSGFDAFISSAERDRPKVLARIQRERERRLR